MNGRSLALRLITAGVLGAAILFVAVHRDSFQAAALQQALRRFGPWAPLLFVVFYGVGTVLFVPGSAFSLAGGALFGPLWGTIWNLAGATCGATSAFLFARYLASGWVTQASGPRLKRILRGVEDEGWRFVAFVRLVPLFPFNLLNYALGLTGIRLTVYVLASALCMAPGAFAYTWLGYAGRQAVAGSAETIRDVIIAIGLIAATALLPRMVGRFKEKPNFITSSELNERLKRTPEPVVIDVRTQEEFTGPLGHIPGARNLALRDLLADVALVSVKPDAPIVLVCKTDKRSARAASALREAGFAQVWVLQDGIEGWRQSGYSTENRSPASEGSAGPETPHVS